MSNPLHICSTGINKLRGDEENTRTVEVEVANFEVTPSIRMKAAFKVVLVESRKDGPRLELRDANGAFLGYVPLKSSV